MGEWIQATITKRHNWTPDLMTIQLGEVQPRFVPGQFFNLGLLLDGKLLKRAYSAASAPGEALEFVISRVPNGAFTPALFDLQVGQTLTMDSAGTGFFTLDFLPTGVLDLWLIATGTGIGPYISMLRAGALAAFERVVLVHGVRHANQLTYADELSQAHNVVYVPALTASDERCSSGLHGRIPTLIGSGEVERAAGLTLELERAHVMLCGNPDMIRDGIAVLENRGLRRHKRREPGHFTTEKYW